MSQTDGGEGSLRGFRPEFALSIGLDDFKSVIVPLTPTFSGALATSSSVPQLLKFFNLTSGLLNHIADSRQDHPPSEIPEVHVPVRLHTDFRIWRIEFQSKGIPVRSRPTALLRFRLETACDIDHIAKLHSTRSLGIELLSSLPRTTGNYHPACPSTTQCPRWAEALC